MPALVIMTRVGEPTAAVVDPFLAAIASEGDSVPCDIGVTDTAGMSGTGVGALATEKEQED